MRWGPSNGEDRTSEDSPTPLFPPVNEPQVNPAGHEPEDEPELPGAADAAVEHPAETAPAVQASESIARAVAVELGAAAPHDAGEDDAVDPIDLAVPGEDAVPVPLPVPRSGRNLGLATVVGVGLGAGALVLAWWHPLAFAVLLYAFCLAAVIEWRGALAKRGIHISLPPVLLATVGMGIATWFGAAEGLIVALLVSAAGIVAWRVVDDRVENTLADSLASIFTMTWIPFLGSFLLLLERSDEGWVRVFIVLVAVVLNDTGALFSGMLLGRHKLAPNVSPKKTWEGAIGGAALGTLGAAVAAGLLLDGRWWVGAAVGLACVVAAVLGDLAESALKRDIAIKDMSNAIPGHGGILDRVDSLLPAAAAAYTVFALLIGTR